jgi:PhnB protein
MNRAAMVAVDNSRPSRSWPMAAHRGTRVAARLALVFHLGSAMKIEEVFAYLCVSDTAAAIRFYDRAFGAKEKFRLTEPGGRVGHAELDFGGATVMLSDEFPEMGVRSASSLGATPVTIHLHVDDADAMIEQAVRAGATLERAASDAFYGERSGTVRCPFGHRWLIGHHIEDVSPQEMQRRYTARADRGVARGRRQGQAGFRGDDDDA